MQTCERPILYRQPETQNPLPISADLLASTWTTELNNPVINEGTAIDSSVIAGSRYQRDEPPPTYFRWKLDDIETATTLSAPTLSRAHTEHRDNFSFKVYLTFGCQCIKYYQHLVITSPLKPNSENPIALDPDELNPLKWRTEYQDFTDYKTIDDTKLSVAGKCCSHDNDSKACYFVEVSPSSNILIILNI